MLPTDLIMDNRDWILVGEVATMCSLVAFFAGEAIGYSRARRDMDRLWKAFKINVPEQ